MKNVHKIIALLLAMIMVLSLAACGAEKQADVPATDEAEEITISLWAGNEMIGADEFKQPEEEWNISKAIKRFQEQYPNVKFEISTYTDNAQLMNDYKAAMLAGYGPDIVCMMSGPNVLSVKEGLTPLNDYLTDDLLNNIVGWDTCADNMDASQTIYAIPYAGQSVACFAYNKSLIAQAGLDFENDPPRTIDEFYAALDTIKAAGIQPLHLDESYPGLLLYCLGMWWEQKTGLDGIVAHTFENTPYAEDEGFLFMLEEYKKFYDNGWINEDTATSVDAYNEFLQGNAALCTYGIWDMSSFQEALGDDFGLLSVPTADESLTDVKTAVGGVGASLVVSSFSEHQEIAVEFIKFLVSKDEMIEYYKTNPSIPVRTDITPEDIGQDENPIFAEMMDMASGIYYWPDNCMSSDATNIYYSMPCQVLVGNMTAEELAEMIDDAQAD